MPGFMPKHTSRKRVRPLASNSAKSEADPKPLKPALKQQKRTPAPAVPRRAHAMARANSFDSEAEADEIDVQTQLQKKMKSDIRPDYVERRERINEQRLQRLQHNLEDARGFMLNPLGLTQASQPKRVHAKSHVSTSSSAVATSHPARKQVDHASLVVPDDGGHNDDEEPPSEERGSSSRTDGLARDPSSSDATSDEGFEGETLASVWSSIAKSHTDNANSENTTDWSFLDSSKIATPRFPSVPSQPLQFPQPTFLSPVMQPMMMPPYPQAIMTLPHMQVVQLTRGLEATIPAMTTPNQPLTAATATWSPPLKFFDDCPTDGSSVATQISPDPRVQEVLEDAPF